MAYPKILQRLFEDFGAGPKLRGDILPFGSKEGTACEGDDARLSNARVPETHNETHKTGGTDPLTPADIGAHPADGMASTDKAGIVRLSSATDMDSEDQASTPKAVKAAYELADTAKSMAAEAQGKADAAYEKATLDATTDVAGRTQLSNEVDSDREDMAATPRAVKSVHDKAIEAASAASAAQALAASAESTATAAKTNADKVPGISTQVKALEEKVQTATPDKLGLVRIGQGISVDETGLISTESITLATPDAPGIVQVGAGLEVTLPTEAAEGEEAPTPGVLSLGAHASSAGSAYGQGSSTQFGHLKVVDTWDSGSKASDGIALSPAGVVDAITAAGGKISVTGAAMAADGIAISPAGANAMIAAAQWDITPDWEGNGGTDIGTILDDGGLLVTKSGSVTLEDGIYLMVAVGGGGQGGKPTQQKISSKYVYRHGGGGAAAIPVNITTQLEGTVTFNVAGGMGTTSISTTSNVVLSAAPGASAGGAPASAVGGGQGGVNPGTITSVSSQSPAAGASNSCSGGSAGGNNGGGGGEGSKFSYGGCSIQANNGTGYYDYGGRGGYGYGAGGGGGYGGAGGAANYNGGAGSQGAVYIKRLS